MKHKKISFSVLEEIEKKKIKKEIINIKNLYVKKKQNDEQLNLLVNYQKEYIKNIHEKMILGVCIYQWKNYNNFIFILQVIIKDNMNIIKKNQETIQESLKRWSQNQIKLKTWQYLSIKNKEKKLKIQKIQEQILNDDYIQLEILKKGLLL